VNVTLDSGCATERKTTFDVPPPGDGLDTVMDAVVAMAMCEAGTVAVNCEPETNVVANDVPFQLTTDALTNPVPLTVTVKPPPPGATLMGTRGWFTRGTGLVWANARLLAIPTSRKRRRMVFIADLQCS